MFVCVSVYGFVCVCDCSALGDQKGASDPLQL